MPQSDAETSYRPLLLPETVEIAFAAIRSSLEKSFMARRLRPLTPPVLLPASPDQSASTAFTCRGREGRYTLPSDLTEWKIEKMRRYGIGSGYGLYTYILTVDPDAPSSPVAGPAGDRLECIRDIAPDSPAPSTIIESLRWLYEAIRKAEAATCAMFPHIRPSLPRQLSIASSGDDILHACRTAGAVAALSAGGNNAEILLWSHAAGMPVKVAQVGLLLHKFISGWCSPSLVAMIILHQASIEEIFPIDFRFG